VRASYLLLARKLDMEMPPDSLEVGGVNDRFKYSNQNNIR
jgi:hypothetical protein